MRLSDILKAEENLIRAVPPAPSKEAPRKKSVAADPEISAQQIRKQVEAELNSQTEKIKAEADARIAREKALSLEREKSYQAEYQSLLERVRDLEQQNTVVIQGVKKQMEEDFNQRLAAERKKIEEQTSAQFSEAAEKMKDKVQKDLIQKDQELKSKAEQLEAEVSKRVEAERNRIEKQVRDDMSASSGKMVEDFKRKIKEKDLAGAPAKEEEVKPVTPTVRYTAPPMPPAEPALTLASLKLSNEADADCRRLYQEIVMTGARAFEQISKGKPFDLAPLKILLESVISKLPEKEADFLFLAEQAYPQTDYFIFHCVNSTLLASIIGLDFNLSKEQLRNLALSAFLHDIGLLNLREDLNYPKQLSADIQTEVRNHPERAVEVLAGQVDESVLSGIHQHHETDDGKGYPGGLRGDDIGIFARIIQAVDTFEAMIHTRPYRQKPYPVNQAIKEMLEKGRGVYHKDVLKSLMGRVGLYPINILVELSNKQIARVVRQNRLFPLSPIVVIEYDESGRKLPTALPLDLSKNQLVHILAAIDHVPSYTEERIEQQHKRVVEKQFSAPLREFVPFVLIVAALFILIYIVFKI